MSAFLSWGVRRGNEEPLGKSLWGLWLQVATIATQLPWASLGLEDTEMNGRGGRCVGRGQTGTRLFEPMGRRGRETSVSSP